MKVPGSLPTLASFVFIRITEFARRPVPEQARLRAQLAAPLARLGAAMSDMTQLGRYKILGELGRGAMELLEGVDLGAQAATRRFSVTEAVSIVEQVADALSFAHDRGVVHRDIKPPNIMLVGGGRVKIMDFGIARMRSSDLKTQTGLMMGTPRYMSPEQVAGRPVDQRSDIFSLGTVLY